MTTKALPASAGWQWLKEGAKFTVENPVLFLWVLFTYLLSSIAVSMAILSWIIGVLLGAIFSSEVLGILFGISFFSCICTSSLALLLTSLMSICRGIARGEATSFEMYFAPWRKFGPLFKLSRLCTLVSVVAAVIVCSAIYLGANLYIGNRGLAGGRGWEGLFYGSLTGLVTAIIIFTPFWVVFSFSSLLIAFQEWDVTKAIKLGFFTSLKNWGAFLVNGAIWIMLIIIQAMAFIAALESTKGDISQVEKTVILFSAGSGFVLTIFFANCYRCYAALFPEDEPVQASVAR